MIPYIFFNYAIEKDGNPIDPIAQVALIKELVGIEVAYRKSHPRPADCDTCIITPHEEESKIGEISVKILTFGIAKHVTSRNANKWDKEKDVVKEITYVADEDVIGFVLMLPGYGKIAVVDRTGEQYLPAKSTLGRFRAVIQSRKGYSLNFSPISTSSELSNALKSWQLSEFTFSAKPFNPSVRRQGQKLHEILTPNNAKIQGRITPNHGESLEYKENDGIMWEVVGLAEKGYGEYGAKGTTTDGQQIQIAKTSPTEGKPPVIRMFLDTILTGAEKGIVLARAMLDIHGDH